jgi:hypothetical protein
MSQVRFNQWEDIVLGPATGDLVRDFSGTLFTGTAELYICPPDGVFASVTSIPITVTAGVWSYEFMADTAGKWSYEIRAEGSIHGTSGKHAILVNPSPFPAPAVPVTP